MNRPYLLASATVLLLISILPIKVKASHILGGEIRMEATAEANRFSFSMIQFWDQTKLTVANREPSVEILFYRKRDNQLVYRTSLPYVSSRNVNYQNQVCTGIRTLKTVEGTYNASVALNPADFSDSGGYYIVWERCCRNADIGNIREPGASGLVFYLEFPALSVRNSSPLFDLANGDYICLGLPYSMNVSATDADGDELRYSLVTPFRGNTDLANPLGNDSPKSGYPLVEWMPGVSAQNMIPGSPALTINAQTGKLTVTANQLGLYVFTVQCEEFRNGMKIGVVRRDFQSLVIECNPRVPLTPTILYNQQPARTVELCGEAPIMFELQETDDWMYQWQLNGQDIAGATNPSLLVSKTGSYTVIKSAKNTDQDQCTKPVASTPVEVVQPASLSASIKKSSDVLCMGGSLQLLAERNNSYSYEWRIGMNRLTESGPILTIEVAGVYSLLVRDESNGCSAITSVEIKEESVGVTLPVQVEVMRGQSVLLMPTVISSSSSIDYLWSPPTGLSTINIAQPLASPGQTTKYSLQVKTPGGCQATAGITVLVNDCQEILIPKPTISYQNKSVKMAELCAGRALVLQTENTGDWLYQWQLNGLDIPGATTSSHTVDKIGRYTIVRSARSVGIGTCVKPAISAEIEVIEGILPLAFIRSTSPVLCLGVPLTLDAGNAGNSSYEWSLDGKKLNEASPQIDTKSPGLYAVLVRDEVNGCRATDSIRIEEETIQVVLPEEMTIKRGESVTLQAQVVSKASSITYAWFPTVGLSNPADSMPVALPDQSTEYILQVETPGGCQATDSLRLTIIDRIFLPDAFSPNGDGINDVFTIQNGQSLVETIRIYNRWGQVVFTSTGYGIPWNGYYDDELVPRGMYNYIIKTPDHVFKGSIQVIY